MSPKKLISVPAGFAFSTLICILYLTGCDSEQKNETTGNNPLTGRSSSIEVEKINQYLIARLDSAATAALVIDGDTITESGMYRRAYICHQFIPFWIDKNGITSNALDFVKVLNDIRFDGLDPADYHAQEIEKFMTLFNKGNVESNQVAEFELRMTKAFLTLASDLLMGRDTLLQNAKDWKLENDIPADYGHVLCKATENNDVTAAIGLIRPTHRYYRAFMEEYKHLDRIARAGGWDILQKPTDSLTKDTSGVWFKALRKRLYIETGRPSDTSSASWSDDLSEAVRKFQFTNQVKVSGKVDSVTLLRLNRDVHSKMNTLAVNMERLRWMKRQQSQPYIWVDVAKMELDYVENDSVQFNMRVVVGKPSRRTTMLDARLENIVFSPPWTVPPTILKEDVIPGIARRGSSYLTRKGLRVYDKNGKRVNTGSVTAKNIRQYKVRQAPGYRSSLGEVKFNLLNPYSIYLHDTPHREDFVKSYRANSSGCIRVHHPKEFAEFLLRDSLKYSYAMIDSICKTRKTKYIPMRRDVMVHIVYLTNALDSTGKVMYLRDIYTWDDTMK